MVSKKKINHLMEMVDDYIEWFPRYCDAIEEILMVASEVNAYIRERCEPILTEKHIMQLDEMDRDICIIRSRLMSLDFKLRDAILEACKIEKYTKRSKAKAEKVNARVDKCGESFMTWAKLKKDFHKSLRDVEDKWHCFENRILATLSKYEQ